MKFRWWAAPLFALCIAMVPSMQDRFAGVEIEAIELTDNISMLIGAGGNIAVHHGEDGLFMIDDQFEPLAEKIQAALQQFGDDLPTYLLNTHHHGDHTGGNPEFGPKASVIAHASVRQRLVDNGMVRAGLPEITYEDSVTLHFNGDTVQIRHFPHAHTDGDSVAIFENSQVAHLGDLFFSGRFPFIDLDSGGSVASYIDAIEELVDTLPEDVQIIPGHGPLSNLDDLRDYFEMLTETSDLVQERIDAGKSLSEMTREGLPEKFAEWGTGFINEERWIQILHRSATD